MPGPVKLTRGAIFAGMGRIMGIDFGLRRTGISVTDPEQIIVQGLATQETSGLMNFIKAYSVREKLDEIVVGYPFVEESWGDPLFRKQLDQFISDLKKYFPEIRISIHDERFTSVRAREVIHQSGRKKSKRQDKALLDQTSAILILQEYLGHI